MSQEHESKIIRSVMFMLLQHFQFFKPTMFLRCCFQSEAMELSRGRCHITILFNLSHGVRVRKECPGSIQIEVSQEHCRKMLIDTEEHLGLPFIKKKNILKSIIKHKKNTIKYKYFF